jgi:hypothetical protein
MCDGHSMPAVPVAALKAQYLKAGQVVPTGPFSNHG